MTFLLRPDVKAPSLQTSFYKAFNHALHALASFYGDAGAKWGCHI